MDRPGIRPASMSTCVETISSMVGDNQIMRASIDIEVLL